MVISGPRATTNCLIVLILIVTKGKVVHSTLGVSHNTEGAIETVGEDLGGFHIAGDDGGGVGGVKETAGGDDETEGFIDAGIEGDVVFYESAKNIQYYRLSYG